MVGFLLHAVSDVARAVAFAGLLPACVGRSPDFSVNAPRWTKRKGRKEVARLVCNARSALDVQLMLSHGVEEVPMAIWTWWTIGLLVVAEQTAKVRAVE